MFALHLPKKDNRSTLVGVFIQLGGFRERGDTCFWQPFEMAQPARFK